MLFKDNNAVSIYFSYINKYPLLSKKEEKKLSAEISKWRALEKKIEKKRKKGLSDEEIKSFIEENKLQPVIQDGREAFDKMTRSNLKLVVSIAKRFIGRSPHLKFLDLIQEGNIGLMGAVKRFDPERKCRISTYATHWIKQALERAVADNDDDIRLPVYLSIDLNNFRKTHRKLSLRLRRDPNKEEILREIKLDSKVGEKIRSKRVGQLELLNNRRFYQLEAPMAGLEDMVLLDLIKDEINLGPDQLFEKIQLKRHLSEIMKDTLKDKEFQVVSLRFGLLEDGSEKSLEEIGKMLGVTRERVRQIEKVAIKKLQKRLKNLESTSRMYR
ncbi:MAG: RNA polymerase sigma factor RpoD/SigA [Parcubacteria group bacterium]|nr:RNA polymerase sigma factor RpoD/SigA [Parcubacteria group bacterium]MCR4342350.1 RNA polymerase sigma factor RpoD/SigA [Patescibacteria group bacterium]